MLSFDSKLKNNQVVKSLQDDIIVVEDLKLFNTLPMTKMQALQDRVFYEVNDLTYNSSSIF